jgi:hypothetical protein
MTFNLLRRGRAREAIQFLDTIVADHKYDSSCYQRYFWAYLELKKWDKAEATLDLDFNNEYKKIFRDFLYINTGRAEKGRIELNELKQEIAKSLSEKRTFDIILKMIFIHTLLDEKEKALDYLSELEKTYFLTNRIDAF